MPELICEPRVVSAVDPPRQVAVGQKIAYLLSQYPAVSHTFFLNEVLELRALGFDLATASVNRIHAPPDGFPPREQQEAQTTFYLKAQKIPRICAVLARVAFGRPAVLLRGLAAALRLDPGNPAVTLYGLFYLVEALLLGDWMRSEGRDHLHVHFAGPVATVGMLAAIAWQIPYSLTLHGPDEFYNVDAFFLKEKIRRARFIFCISDFCRSQVLRLAAPEQWAKVHVCRLGVDEAMFYPERTSNSMPRILSVGRLHPSKGHLILLQALLLLRERGCYPTLDLIGGGPERARLEGFVQQNHLDGQVTLHGAVSHVRARALLRGADLFVLASFAEGVPVALMEAMAMEIACVSTSIAGIPELIRPGLDGALVAPASPEQLADTLFDLLRDPDRCHRLACSGREQVHARYNLQKNVLHLAHTFALCLGQPRIQETL